MTGALRLLEDRAAIHDLLVRYASAVDRRDWPALAACFTPDAHADYGFFSGDLPSVVGAIRAGLEQFAHTMHFLGDQLIEVAGATATSETYAVCYHRRGDQDLTVGVRYLDDLVRRRGRWLIGRRVMTVEWQRLDRVVLPPG